MNFTFDWTGALEKAKKGDKKSLDMHLEKAYYEVLMPKMLKKSKSKEDAEDICCQAISEFWKRFFIREEPLPENVNGYLYIMGRNTHFYFYKMENKRNKNKVSIEAENVNQIFGSLQTQEEGVSADEKENMFRAMEAGFEKLCDTCRVLLKATIYEGKKLKDYYADLEFPTANAASKKKRKCIQKLISLTYKEL